MKSQIEFFAEVEERLKANKITIALLAHKLQFSRTGFYHWASGEVNAHYDTVVKISNFLDEIEDEKYNAVPNPFRHQLYLNHPKCEKMMKAEYLSGTKISDIAIAFDAPPDMVVKLIEKSDSVFLKING